MNHYMQLRRSGLRAPKLRLGWRELVWAVVIVATSSSLAVWTEPFLGLVTAALIFVLGVTVVGALYGLAASVIAAFAAFLIYNFFLTEPFLSFRMATSKDLAPLIAFNISALIAGVLAGRLQDRAQAAQQSNLQLLSLLETSQALQSALQPDEVVQQLATTAPARLGIELRLFQQAQDGLVEAGGARAGASTPLLWRQVAEDIWRQQAGMHQAFGLTGFLLQGSSGPVGVLVIGSHKGVPTLIEPSFLAALANILALALERAALSEDVTEARAAARSEELKTALLSSVSHDFRTPLAAISASASSLIEFESQLAPETRHQLLRSIVEECDRLNRYTANLLELSKLQANVAAQNGQVVDVVEILGAAIQRIRSKLGARVIERHLPDGIALVRADPALFELALVNVIDNAVTYSDDGSTIALSVRGEGSQVAIDISDEGCGIPAEDLARVFDRFYRVRRAEAKPRGSGLGLAIAKGFVEAFGGSIRAETPGLNGRGTRIAIRLPAAQVQ